MRECLEEDVPVGLAPTPDLLAQQPLGVGQVDAEAVMVVVVADGKGVVEVAGRGVAIGAAAAEHRALEELAGEQFHRRDGAVSLLGIDIDSLVPGDFGGVEGRSEGKLGVMAVVAARLLAEAVRPRRRRLQKAATLPPSPSIARAASASAAR